MSHLLSADTRSAVVVILNFQAFRLWEINVCCLEATPFKGYLSQQPKQTKTMPLALFQVFHYYLQCCSWHLLVLRCEFGEFLSVLSSVTKNKIVQNMDFQFCLILLNDSWRGWTSLYWGHLFFELTFDGHNFALCPNTMLCTSPLDI